MKHDLFEDNGAARREGLILYVDGASRGNPGPSAVGVVLYDGGKRVVRSFGKYIGETTNNVAEYTALLYGIQEALQQQAKTLKVHTDSELLARQMQGRYKVKEPQLKVLNEQIHYLIPGFRSFSIQHIPREKNREADRLANQAINEMRL